MKISRNSLKNIILGVVIIGVSVGSVCLYKNYLYRNEIAEMTFSEIDISTIPDGKYIGECDVDYIYAKVEVTVEDGELVYIDLLEHKNDRGEPAEVVIDDMLDQQTTDVDAVSGATNSSKVIRKATENALLGAADIS